MHEFPYWRLAGAYFFYFAYLGAFAPYFSLYLSSLGIAAAGIGAIMSLPQLVRIFAPHLWGWLADRGGHRLRVARVCSLIGTATYCGLFAASGEVHRPGPPAVGLSGAAPRKLTRITGTGLARMGFIGLPVRDQ